MPLQHKNSARRYVNECTWLCSKRTLLPKTGGGWIWSGGHSLPTLGLKGGPFNFKKEEKKKDDEKVVCI